MDNSTVSPSPGQVQFPGAFKLLKPSMHAVGINFWTIVKLFLLPLIPLIVIGALFFAIGSNSSCHHRSSSIDRRHHGTLLRLLHTARVAPAYALLTGAKEKHITVGEALSGAKPYFWRYLGLSIILTIIFTISTILFVVPFFFMLRRYMLAPYYLIDKNLGIREALHQSAVDSRKYSSYIWGVIGVEFLLGILCAVPVLGVVLRIMYGAAPAIRYQQIQDAEHPSAPATPVAPGMPVVPITNPLPPQAPMPPINPQQPPLPPRPLIQ